MNEIDKIKALVEMLSKFGISELDIIEICHNSHLGNYMVLSNGGETIFCLTIEAYENLGVIESCALEKQLDEI